MSDPAAPAIPAARPAEDVQIVADTHTVKRSDLQHGAHAELVWAQTCGRLLRDITHELERRGLKPANARIVVELRVEAVPDDGQPEPEPAVEGPGHFYNTQ